MWGGIGGREEKVFELQHLTGQPPFPSECRQGDIRPQYHLRKGFCSFIKGGVSYFREGLDI